MSANTFGHIFKCHTFGESHGKAVGVVIDGCPAQVPLSLSDLKKDLERRRPGKQPWASARQEPDEPEILSGVFENMTLGTPICLLVRNRDARSKDYEFIKKSFRAGHADDLFLEKFQHADLRGGGRASGRETLSRVLAGAVAKAFVKKQAPDVRIGASVSQIGDLEVSTDSLSDEAIAKLMQAKEQGDSLSSQVRLFIEGLPKGLGQPVFKKFKSDLSMALMSLGASLSFEVGSKDSLKQTGRLFHANKQNYGGLRGGLTTGEKLTVHLGFKPPSSLGEISQKGRHDPSIAPRAAVVVEAMAHLVVADHLLWRRLDCFS